MSIFQDPQFAPLEQIFMQIMLVYKNLEKTAKKLAKSISYNDNNSSQGQLPPNLRLILVSQTWPQGLDREACQKLDKEEQLLWNDTLQKIFLQRQNFLRNSYNEYKKHIGKYSEPDSLREIIVTEHPEIEAHRLGDGCASISGCSVTIISRREWGSEYFPICCLYSL